MKKIKLFVLQLILVFLASCEYDPQGYYDAEIPKPELNTVSLNLDNDGSSLDIFSPTTFNYSIDIGGLFLYEIQFYLNNEQIHSNNDTVGSFYVDPLDYSVGTYELSMKAFTNTGSGSLGDVTMNEAFIVNYAWEVHIDGLAPNQIDITSIDKVDGTLEISWEKYERRNFQKYEIYKTIMTYYSYSKHLLAVVVDPEITSFIDSSYVGEKADYQVSIVASDQSVSGDLVSVNYGLPEIVKTEKSSSTITFTFTKCQFPANFQAYKLSESDHRSYNSEEIEKAYITSIDDTTITVHNIRFGNSVMFNLRTYPKNYEVPNEYYIHTNYTTYVGERTPQNGTFLNITTDTEYLYPFKMNYPRDDFYIYRYSTKSNQNVDSILLPVGDRSIDISVNSQYLIAGREDKFYKINPLDLSDYTEYSNVDITGDDSDNFNYMSVSNDGIAALSCSKSFILYDCNTDQIIYQDSIQRNEAEISANSKYIVCKLNHYEIAFYKYEAGVVSYIDTRNADGYYYEFNPQDPNEYYFTTNNPEMQLVFVDCETATVNRSFSINMPYISSIDPATGNVVVQNKYEENSFYLQHDVVDIYTGEILKSVYLFSRGYNFINYTLYSGLGYRIKLEL